MVIFGMKQYHKDPPPKKYITKIVSILKDITNIDLCKDIEYKPNIATIKEFYNITPYITDKGVKTDTMYMNTPNITMIKKIIFYNKSIKNKLAFKVWRIEATIEIPNIKELALPLYEFKELLNQLQQPQQLS